MQGSVTFPTLKKRLRTNGEHTHEGRAHFRAEIDASVAHRYGLTESEFTHILGTFPLVEPGVKAAALAAFRAGD